MLLAVTAWAFAGTAGIVYAVIFGAVSMRARAPHQPEAGAVHVQGARGSAKLSFPPARILAQLASRAGLPTVPRLYVIPSKLMNAFAVGRRERCRRSPSPMRSPAS